MIFNQMQIGQTLEMATVTIDASRVIVYDTYGNMHSSVGEFQVPKGCIVIYQFMFGKDAELYGGECEKICEITEGSYIMRINGDCVLSHC